MKMMEFAVLTARSGAGPLLVSLTVFRRRRPAEFIIFNAKFLAFDTQSLAFDTQLLVFDTKFIIFTHFGTRGIL